MAKECLSPDQIEELAQLRAEGWSAADLGRRFGRSKRRVYALLAEHAAIREGRLVRPPKKKRKPPAPPRPRRTIGARERAVCNALRRAKGRRIELRLLDGTVVGVLARLHQSISDPEASTIHLTDGCTFTPRPEPRRWPKPKHQPNATIALLDVVAVYDLTGGEHVRIA